jgi:hypothetical protein
MYNFASINDLPKVGETLHLSTSMSGHTYHLLAVSPSQFSLLFNGKHKFFIDFPVFVRGKHKESVCNLVLDYSKWDATWKWIPRPEAYKCPLRRWLAENYIRQNVIEFSETFTRSFGFEEWCGTPQCIADSSKGEQVVVSDDWSYENTTPMDDDSHWQTEVYKGGTAALVYTINDFSTTTYRGRKLTRIIINPKRRKEGVEWVLGKLNPHHHED